jgi:hypothetical protein
VSKERIIEIGHAIVVARNNVTFGESMANIARGQLKALETELDDLLGDGANEEDDGESCDVMTVGDIRGQAYEQSAFSDALKKMLSRDALKETLLRGSVLVAVDATRDDVVVPTTFKTDPQLVLRIGYDLQPPIHDLVISSSGIFGSLSFSGVPFYCKIPWSAVLGMKSDADPTAVRPLKKANHLKLVPLCLSCNDDPKVPCAACDGPVEDDGPGAA